MTARREEMRREVATTNERSRAGPTPDRQNVSRSVLCGVALVFGLLLGQPTQAQLLFTSASLQGTYSYVNTSADVASIGLISFDGSGKLTLAIKVNGPGTGETRTITSLAGTGTYTMEAGGTGAATIEFKGADVERHGTFDFVITEAVPRKKGVPALATDVFAVQQVGGLHGQLVTPVWKRRPD